MHVSPRMTRACYIWGQYIIFRVFSRRATRFVGGDVSAEVFVKGLDESLGSTPPASAETGVKFSMSLTYSVKRNNDSLRLPPRIKL